MPIGTLPYDDALTGALPGMGVPGTLQSPRVGVDTVVEYNGLFINRHFDEDHNRLAEEIRMKGITIGDAEIRASADPNPQQHGETPHRPFYSGRTITLDLELKAQTVERVRDYELAVATAFVDLDRELPMIFHIDDFEREVLIYCKKSAPTGTKDSQENLDPARDKLVTLRASNPRFLSRRSLFGFWEPETATVTNTAILVPLNAGNFPAQIRIVMRGPMTNPQILNTLTGQFLGIDGTIGAGDSVELKQFGNYSYVIDSNGHSRFRDLNDDSEWFELQPKDLAPTGNTLLFSASGMDTNESRVSIHWNNTWWPT